MRATIMKVDTGKFKENIKKIKAYVGNKKLMPVIKANAYGTYINTRNDLISEFDIVAVAIADEAVFLREQGFKNEIFILNQPYIDELDDIIKYDITIGLSDETFLEKILEIKEKIKVHLELETGMNRTGIKLDNLSSFMTKIKKNPNIIVEGVYTHLSSADYDESYTNKQLEIFKEGVQVIKSNFDTIKYIHSSASNGLMNYNDNVSNMVRPGIIMYGYESFDGALTKINVEPICKLKTKITFIKEVSENESISYSRKYITNKKMVIATIPIGYADGLRRELSNKGAVIVNGKKAPILGSICMDSCMIDVTDIKGVRVGCDAYIWDNCVQTIEDIAGECNTINYEILSTISNRVPRTFEE